MRARTVVAIAHRLSTLQDFDRIVVMREGRIIDDDTPQKLCACPGLYQELPKRQFGHFKDLDYSKQSNTI